MARRQTYSRFNKTNQYRPSHVKGQIFYKVFQCLNADCTNIISVKCSEITEDYSIFCPVCGYEHYSGGYHYLFDFSMDVDQPDGSTNTVGTGEFGVNHDDYIEKAPLYKYCTLCNTLKPISYFHYHDIDKGTFQSECMSCKTDYNEQKNITRLSEQHFESSQKRRLLVDVAGTARVSRRTIEAKYNHKCFCCGKDLSSVTSNKEKPIDHTLPVKYLWPATTDSGTLLCRDCNGGKSGTWPSDFYKDAKLHELAVYTGFDYHLLAGSPQYNPDALLRLQDAVAVDALLAKHASHMEEVCKLRNRILDETGIDFFSHSTTISATWIAYADSLR